MSRTSVAVKVLFDSHPDGRELDPRRSSAGEIEHEAGTVVGLVGPHYEVRCAASRILAKRAASCLVEPKLGDLVALALVEGGSRYILHVLEAKETARTVAIDGDLEIVARDGTLSIAGREGVRVASNGEVSLVAGRLSLAAVEADVVIDKLRYVGRTLRCQLDRYKAVVANVELVAERYRQIVKRCYRFVAEREQVRAGQIDYVADETMTVRSRNTMLTAEQLLKVDAEQIHLG